MLFENDLSSSRAQDEIMGYIDTGTSLLVGPEKEIAAFAENAGAHPKPSVGGYALKSCDPNNVPSLSFTIQGKDYAIPGSLLVMVRSMRRILTSGKKTNCYFLLMGVLSLH